MYCNIALVISLLLLLCIIFLMRSSAESFALLTSDSSIITSKNSLVANDTTFSNASQNLYKVFQLKDANTLLPVVTTKPGWNPATGKQDLLCTADKTVNTFPPQYYQLVNSDAVCKTKTDETVLFSPVDTSTGKQYLKGESEIASTLRSGAGRSCSQQLAADLKLQIDETGKYYRMGRTEPVCATSADTMYYSEPQVVDIGTILKTSKYV